MTSIGDTSGYSTGWFSPRTVFTTEKSISWDVNVTDLKNRQWWEVSVVPVTFYSGVAACPGCTSTLGASNLPAPPADAVIASIGPNSDVSVFAGGSQHGVGQSMCSGWNALDLEGCASKAIRRTFSLTDNGNGTVTFRFGANAWTYKGSFPAGGYKVVFKDHNYTPDKDGRPVGHTWHWDNIIVQ